MADGERDPDQGTGPDTEPQQEKAPPSLELPRLSLRRRNRERPRPQADAPATPAPAAPPAPPRTAPRPRSAPVATAEPQPERDPGHTATSTAPVAAPEAAPDTDAPARPARRLPRLPRPAGNGGLPAVVVTGLVVGLGMVGLTWAAMRTCEVARGTSSCGGTGYPVLLVILVLMVLVGTALLRAARVPDAAATSVLAVGMASVVALAFLVDVLLDRSMVVVLPLVTAATYAAAHWVTRTFVEPADR